MVQVAPVDRHIASGEHATAVTLSHGSPLPGGSQPHGSTQVQRNSEAVHHDRQQSGVTQQMACGAVLQPDTGRIGGDLRLTGVDHQRDIGSGGASRAHVGGGCTSADLDQRECFQRRPSGAGKVAGRLLLIVGESVEELVRDLIDGLVDQQSVGAHQPHVEQVGLIENELGEIGIDGGFLKEAGIEIREMNSGCICCSLVGDFGASLKEVIDSALEAK